MENRRVKKNPYERDPLISSILDSIPHAVFGLRNRKIVFVNEAVKAVFGWKPEELIGEDTRRLYRNETEYEEIAGRFYSALEKQRVYRDELSWRRKDGGDIILGIKERTELSNGSFLIESQKGSGATIRLSW